MKIGLKSIIFYADKDLLICISSSGTSKILSMEQSTQKIGCKVLTLTGFDKNKLKLEI